MNWAVSVAQLVATLTMMFLRALLRSHRKHDNGFFSELADGHEMDCLATSLSNCGWHHPGPHGDDGCKKSAGGDINKSKPVTSQEASVKLLRDTLSHAPSCNHHADSWSVRTGRFTPPEGEMDPEPGPPTTTCAQHTLNTRARLGILTKWTSKATPEAYMVDVAIRSVVKGLIDNFLEPDPAKNPSTKPEQNRKFRWQLEIQSECTMGMKCSSQKVAFDIPLQSAPQVAKASEDSASSIKDFIDSILSLWLHSLKKSTKEAAENHILQKTRVLGRRSKRLDRDLQWWVPGSQLFEHHEPRDHNLNITGKTSEGTGKENEEMVDPFPPDGFTIGVQHLGPRGDEPHVVAVDGHLDLPRMMAQHLFTMFMRGQAEHVPVSALVSTHTTIEASDSQDPTRP